MYNKPSQVYLFVEKDFPALEINGPGNRVCAGGSEWNPALPGPAPPAYMRSGASTPIRYSACLSTCFTARVRSRRAARVPGSSTMTLFS